MHVFCFKLTLSAACNQLNELPLEPEAMYANKQREESKDKSEGSRERERDKKGG